MRSENDIFDENSWPSDLPDNPVAQQDPPELIVDIDMDKIGQEAIDVASSICEEFAKCYFDEEFMKEHPYIKRKLDLELEQLRILIKMRKSTEVIYDTNVKAISQCPSNASLYRALAQTSASQLSIGKQIEEVKQQIHSTLKNCQLEIKFDDATSDNNSSPSGNVVRGTKDFIKELRSE